MVVASLVMALTAQQMAATVGMVEAAAVAQFLPTTLAKVATVSLSIAFTSKVAMRYAIIENGKVINIALADSPLGENWIPSDVAAPGWVYQDGVLSAPAAVDLIDPAQWLIDVGPFFDRFGAAKMAILTSTNATVKAIVSDLQVRKWVDLKRPDVATGIDALIALGVAGVNAALKTAVLTTPVTTEENMALKKLYF